MPMNSPFLHCMQSEPKSRLSLTHACEFFLGPDWTRVDPFLTSVELWPICRLFVDQWWTICGFLCTIGDLFWPVDGSLLSCIGLFGYLVIGL